MIDNSVVVELSAVTNTVTGAFDNAAVVECTVRDLAGVEVGGHVWPQAMAYVSDSDGVYRATLQPGVEVKANKPYRVHIDASGSGGEVGHWEEEVRATVRR
jgi:hypothetical protein